MTIARQSESLPVPASAKAAFTKAAVQVRAQLAMADQIQPGNVQ
jgi:hypothetical protein